MAKSTYGLIWLNILMGQSLIGQQHKIENKNTGPQLRAQERAREREGESSSARQYGAHYVLL